MAESPRSECDYCSPLSVAEMCQRFADQLLEGSAIPSLDDFRQLLARSLRFFSEHPKYVQVRDRETYLFGDIHGATGKQSNKDEDVQLNEEDDEEDEESEDGLDFLADFLGPAAPIAEKKKRKAGLADILQFCSRVFERNPEACAVFLGDYCDRGSKDKNDQIGVLVTLLSLAIEFPDNFKLLRGNHECEKTATEQGFGGLVHAIAREYMLVTPKYEEAKQCHPLFAAAIALQGVSPEFTEVTGQLFQVFNLMPLIGSVRVTPSVLSGNGTGEILSDKDVKGHTPDIESNPLHIVLMHGGIPKNVPPLCELNSVFQSDQPVVCHPTGRSAERSQAQILAIELTWNDPCEGDSHHLFVPNSHRGVDAHGKKFCSIWGPGATTNFLKQNAADLIVRGHGHETDVKMHGGKVLTLRSCPDYDLNKSGDPASLLRVNPDGSLTLLTFQAGHEYGEAFAEQPLATPDT
jgi:hypothetical protein